MYPSLLASGATLSNVNYNPGTMWTSSSIVSGTTIYDTDFKGGPNLVKEEQDHEKLKRWLQTHRPK